MRISNKAEVVRARGKGIEKEGEREREREKVFGGKSDQATINEIKRNRVIKIQCYVEVKNE